MVKKESHNFSCNMVCSVDSCWKIQRCRSVIGTKWIYKNKQNEHGIVIQNEARLVVQWFSQVEGIDYGECCLCVLAFRVATTCCATKSESLKHMGCLMPIYLAIGRLWSSDSYYVIHIDSIEVKLQNVIELFACWWLDGYASPRAMDLFWFVKVHDRRF
jgi:hypothetical protein